MSEAVTFTLALAVPLVGEMDSQLTALSFYDETTASWKAEAGKFEALVGNASDQLKLKKAFELK